MRDLRADTWPHFSSRTRPCCSTVARNSSIVPIIAPAQAGGRASSGEGIFRDAGLPEGAAEGSEEGVKVFVVLDGGLELDGTATYVAVKGRVDDDWSGRCALSVNGSPAVLGRINFRGGSMGSACRIYAYVFD